MALGCVVWESQKSWSCCCVGREAEPRASSLHQNYTTVTSRARPCIDTSLHLVVIPRPSDKHVHSVCITRPRTPAVLPSLPSTLPLLVPLTQTPHPPVHPSTPFNGQISSWLARTLSETTSPGTRQIFTKRDAHPAQSPPSTSPLVSDCPPTHARALLTCEPANPVSAETCSCLRR